MNENASYYFDDAQKDSTKCGVEITMCCGAALSIVASNPEYVYIYIYMLNAIELTKTNVAGYIWRLYMAFIDWDMF